MFLLCPCLILLFFPVFHCLNSQQHQSSRAFSLRIFVFQQQVLGLWPVPKPSINDCILVSAGCCRQTSFPLLLAWIAVGSAQHRNVTYQIQPTYTGV